MRINRITLVSMLAGRDWTLKKLSEESGVSRLTISNIKRGASCSAETVEKISKALNVRPIEIVEGE